MAHKHSVYDSDTHFSINPITRALKNEASGKTSVVQYDHNSERFTFEIPRYVEGHDMSLCNSIRVHYINIDARTKEQVSGVYEVDDKQISPNDSNVVVCSWLISRNATQLVGSLNFLIRFACISDGIVEYAWNTATYTNIYVSSGINADETFEDDYADVIEQWKDSVMMEFEKEAQQQLQIAAGQVTEEITKEIEKYIDNKFKGKAGVIYPLATANVPKGFLLCDGAAYSRTDYAELFEAIGTIYGEGDGSTTFNVPNLSTRVPVGTGSGYGLGATGGEESHKLTIDEMPYHGHESRARFVNGGWEYGDYTAKENGAAIDRTHCAYRDKNGVLEDSVSISLFADTGYVGGGKAHNNMQPYTVVNYIISTGKEVEFVVGDGVMLDDEKIDEKTIWSSKNTVDKMCPNITDHVDAITVSDYVEGYPLHVFYQANDNIIHLGKNLVGHNDFTDVAGICRTTSCKDGIYTAKFTTNVYTSRVLTTECDSYVKNYRLPPGTYTFSIKQQSNNSLRFNNCFVVMRDAEGMGHWIYDGYTVRLPHWCDIIEFGCDRIRMTNGTKITFTLQIEAANKATDHEPCRMETLRYVDSKGIDIDVIPYKGSNTFFANGDFDITYKAYPTKVIEKLTNAIIALGGNV